MPLEKIFTSDTDSHNNACLNYYSDMTGAYITGYRRAGDALVSQINDTGRYQDTLIYPIVFLYRQYLELLLKCLIKKGRRLLDKGKGHPLHHRLEDLWPEVKGILRKVCEESKSKDFELIDHVIKEFSAIDPESMSFRYPRNRDGSKPLADITHINTRRLQNFVAEAGDLLEGAEIGISEYLQNHYEMLAELERA